MAKRKKSGNKKPTYYLYVSVIIIAVMFGWSNLWNYLSNLSEGSSETMGAITEWLHAGKEVDFGTDKEDDNTEKESEGTKPEQRSQNIENKNTLKAEQEKKATEKNVTEKNTLERERIEKPELKVKKDETIINSETFTISYNTTTLCPNYVAWRLTKDRVNGKAKRNNKFIPDSRIKESKRVETTDYSGSGYDRGHMCPAGDCKSSDYMMEESFIMTNICPQNGSLNSGDWKELEELCRQWTNDYSDLYIACGPIFDKENGKKIGKRKNIKISVPDRFFKVVLMMGHQPKTLGFIFPNSKTNRDIRDYAISVDEVEEITGIDFYPSLDDNIENKIEAECRPGAWGI